MSHSNNYYWNLGKERLSRVYLGQDIVWSNDPEWGAWSDWTTTPHTGNENKQVETKPQHTYQTYGDYKKEANKIFQKCALPNRDQICPHACRYVPTGSWGNWWSSDGSGGYNCHGWYWTTVKDWGFNGSLGTKSGWVDGTGTTTSTYRVVDTRTLYRYRLNLNA